MSEIKHSAQRVVDAHNDVLNARNAKRERDLSRLRRLIADAQPALARLATPRAVKGFYSGWPGDDWEIEYEEPRGVLILDQRREVADRGDQFHGYYTGAALYYVPARGWWLLHRRSGSWNRYQGQSSEWQDFVEAIDDDTVITLFSIEQIEKRIHRIVDDAVTALSKMRDALA